MNEYDENFITITDEDGKEYELEILATVEYDGALYYALAPMEEDDEQNELEVSILKSVVEDGEELLVAVEDETELENVYGELMDLLYEEDDEQEDEDQDLEL